ncbi:MAG: hypothetical protein N2509_00820 [Treponemataceae bacterium]|nr:hypothetical protein [Treponemataceae bacterium]
MMKRIVHVSVLLLLVGTVVFAADPKFNLNARVSSNLFMYNLTDGKATELMGLGDISNTDTVAISYSDKNAGAYLSLKVSDLISSSGGTAVTDDYYGWMKFGDLKLTAGEWDHRYASRVTTDASSFGGLWDLKYGVLTYSASAEGRVSVTESDNITPWEIEAAADYVFQDLTVSLSTGNVSASNAYKDYNVAEFFGARAAYKVKDVVDANVSFVMNGKNKMQIGAFGNLLMVKGLTLVAGYSGYQDLDNSVNSRNAGELRARYAIDALAITTHNNVTVGDKRLIIYDMVSLSYKINDVITPSLMVANTNFSGDNTAAAQRGNVLVVKPGITLTAQKGATIDAALRFTITNPETGSSSTIMDMPVVFRVKF